MVCIGFVLFVLFVVIGLGLWVWLNACVFGVASGLWFACCLGVVVCSGGCLALGLGLFMVGCCDC